MLQSHKYELVKIHIFINKGEHYPGKPMSDNNIIFTKLLKCKRTTDVMAHFKFNWCPN